MKMVNFLFEQQAITAETHNEFVRANELLEQNKTALQALRPTL